MALQLIATLGIFGFFGIRGAFGHGDKKFLLFPSSPKESYHDNFFQLAHIGVLEFDLSYSP